ncbi:MAG: hypothetical protein HQ579_00010 [Candidatus Omnitrophica bacterium]|nr:hypothetical protein [Candidatus Omnitrophota bacterium]
MSIIQEALKKAEKESFKRVESRVESAALPYSEKASVHPLVKDYLPWVYAVICASVVALAVWLLMAPQRGEESRTLKVAKRINGNELEIKPVVSQSRVAPKPATEKHDIVKVIRRSFYGNSGLTLNGIMYAEGEPLAVINNGIVREGQEVLNVKIVKIRPDAVDVEKAGSLITLKLKP